MEKMKAAVYTEYGPSSNLTLQEVPKPEPKANQVRVKVHAAAVNDYDWSAVRGKPNVYRLMFGFTKPKRPILGMEMSGVVDAVGSSVQSLKVGDAVYGDISDDNFAAFAEYVCVNPKVLTTKPETLSFAEATALSHASMLAYQGLFDCGNLKENQKILINGAGGGVGTFALQLAKLHNANVTGVDTGNKLNMMRNLGFDHVIDYKKEDFTKSGIEYDLILDAKTTRTPADYSKALKPRGEYITVGGDVSKLLGILIKGPFYKKKMRILALKANKDLDYMHQLIAEGKLKCVLEPKQFTLSQAGEAVQYFGDGLHEGKVIINIAE
ncbi:Zn-dependent oxidoreductase, NADPH:quinone reductase [Owenweeksia hongkongensis DSM 17368]|uniref:Zn-dependent oxidoreductase, NADPH:quinone reductase n=1 Tax=Owenweeksia hongkongensis (strain DSM 17368 / CIP 108786 / JCM 12287 / NRRL B-23963 / UST20020801) TaxID=926562 RepID=G8R8A2_OWEHD|nr:NAD(P)-dependent alcohol dehydrogenase [Owenweeksia hongkongensis]AEV33495.1 Zn-dependent oxidoreductase, NADPH:quinone reductase [Owenweeksia hongkongensis DSM 17368]